MTAQLTFRPMLPDDLRLMHEWLQRPHIRRWWIGRETYDEVLAHYLPAIEGSKPTDLYVIMLGDRAAGFIQTYLVSDHPEFARRVDVGQDVAGVDLFLADEELTGQGLGSETLRTFVRDVVFERQETIACIADPDSRNTASLRAFEKAGFRRVRDFFDPTDGRQHTLVRVDRPSS
jgi:RimJ/RimL family protein N-acetyltransferase